MHTAEVARVNGTLYAFLSIDTPSRDLVIVDLSDPANPREVFVRNMGSPFVHDVFVRDGLLFTALWNDGVDDLGHWRRREGRHAGQSRADRERSHGTVVAGSRRKRGA